MAFMQKSLQIVAVIMGSGKTETHKKCYIYVDFVVMGDCTCIA